MNSAATSASTSYTVVLNITIKHPSFEAVLLMESTKHFRSCAKRRQVAQCIVPPKGHLEIVGMTQ